MELNKAVITTKSIVSGDRNILIIYRDNEGDFQFLDGSDVNESDAMVVSLSQIFEIDNSLKNVIGKLQLDETAFRNSLNAPWEYS